MNNTLTLAIVGHFVGDYLAQNDWMALNKKKSTHEGFLAAWTHAWFWTLFVMFFSGWSGLLVFGVLWVSHFIQDSTDIVPRWMRLIGQNQFLTGPCAPWSAIVVDNVWHIVTLWFVWRFLA